MSTARERTTATDKRWDKAIDRILNSGTMSPYMDDFWRFVDGKISYATFCERMPS